MVRRMIVAAVVLAGLLAMSMPARAMCTTGRIGFDKEHKKIIIEMPECHPPE